MHLHAVVLVAYARNGCDVADKIILELFIQRRIDRVLKAREQERMAIGRRLYDGLGGDIAAGTGPVLDDELLGEPVRQPLPNQAHRDVGLAAGGEPYENSYRPRRIGLRACRARDRRKSESHRGKMQKLAAPNFNRSPSIFNASPGPLA